MAIVNRDKGLSEQREVYSRTIAPAIEGSSAAISYYLFQAPYAMAIQSCQVAALGGGVAGATAGGAAGISGSPMGYLEVQRFIVGTGFTQVAGLGSTIAFAAYGTSGSLVGVSGSIGVSLVALGSTLLNLAQGDVVVMRLAYASAATAISQLTMTVVCQALQDIKSHFGLST